MVRAKRHGGSSGRGLCAGGEECALPLPGQAAATQGGAVLAPAPTLAGLVRGKVRCAGLRPHQHLFRVAAAGGQTGQARFGYSRDKRKDCVQVVIALIVTPEIVATSKIETERRAFISSRQPGASCRAS